MNIPISAADIELMHEETIERYTVGVFGKVLGSIELFGSIEDGLRWRVPGHKETFETNTAAALWLAQRRK